MHGLGNDGERISHDFSSNQKLNLDRIPTDPVQLRSLATRYSGLGVRSVGPVGDFLEGG